MLPITTMIRRTGALQRTSQRLQQCVITQHARCVSSGAVNTVILFVPQQEAWVVERMGRFYKTLQPGLNLLIPVLDKIKYVQSLKEIAIDIPEQSAVTHDNVTLRIDGVLYLRVMDAYKASYGVEDPEYAVTQLAQTTMRSEIGKISLDHVFKERESLNINIVEAINNAAMEPWGIKCLRYEIKDIELPSKVKEAMQMQVEAERRKRAVVLESEGIREYEINVAEGKKNATILASEAIKREEINRADGEAAAVIAKAKARAEALTKISQAMSAKDGPNAANLVVAEQYVAAFSKLAKTSNTIVLPSNTGDISSMVGQAMAIYGNLANHQKQLDAAEPEDPDSTTPTEEIHPTQEIDRFLLTGKKTSVAGDDTLKSRLSLGNLTEEDKKS
ncbi:stomatin-like protein stl-1 [Lytechinus pictus]|uniref:stomatin-like protein stl-1 n=1 Tax=Lytechinus pictus TaxID=7653 RepID=UPI00240D0A5F|nr:stomatin-like protein 2, mitochondrial [Lytechinus pictus]